MAFLSTRVSRRDDKKFGQLFVTSQRMLICAKWERAKRTSVNSLLNLFERTKRQARTHWEALYCLPFLRGSDLLPFQNRNRATERSPEPKHACSIDTSDVSRNDEERQQDEEISKQDKVCGYERKENCQMSSIRVFRPSD